MQKDLVATFTNGLGNEHDWTYNHLNPDLPVSAIKEACELLTTLDIFEQNGVKLFDKVVTAKIVTTTERYIFDKTKEAQSKASACEQASTKTAPATTPTITKADEHPANVLNKEALLAAIPKADDKYEYLYNQSKKAIEKSLADSMTSATSVSEPVAKPETKTTETAASASSEPVTTQPDNHKQKAPKKGLFAWLRRRKNRNKDDPDIHSSNPESSS